MSDERNEDAAEEGVNWESEFSAEWEDGLLAESIIRSRSQYFRDTAQRRMSSGPPGAYAIPGMAATPPVAPEPSSLASMPAAAGAPLHTTEAAATSPTPRLPKFILRDLPYSSHIVPPPLLVSSATIGRAEDMAEESWEEVPPPDHGSDTEHRVDTHPERVAAPPEETFSALESELVQDAVPVVVEENLKRSFRCLPAMFIALALALCVVVVVTVVSVCASGSSCTANSDETQNTDSTLDDRETAINAYINRISFATNKPISYWNQSNPEEQALHWILREDPLPLSTFTDLARIRQRYALLTLWFQNVPINPWSNVTGWLDWDDECTWSGVSCHLNGSVSGLELYSTGTQGGIPPDLALLTELQSLLLRCQKSGTYDYSGLSGTVPPSLATLSHLQHLDLDSNNLTGPLSLWLGPWTELQTIDLSLNRWSGTVPAAVVGTWTQLVRLDFSLNWLTGSLPDSIANWTNINAVSFAWNNLTGTLPAGIGAWTNLTYIGVQDNFLEGTIPMETAQWTQLEHALFFPNNFSAPIPDIICQHAETEETELCDAT